MKKFPLFFVVVGLVGCAGPSFSIDEETEKDEVIAEYCNICYECIEEQYGCGECLNYSQDCIDQCIKTISECEEKNGNFYWGNFGECDKNPEISVSCEDYFDWKNAGFMVDGE